MPLLKRELDLFPEGLFDLPVESHPWWVAHVKSRQEKALARHLQPLGIEPGSAVSITDGPFRGYDGSSGS